MMAAAYEGKTVKQWLMDLSMVRLAEMEKRDECFDHTGKLLGVVVCWG